jgi:adenosylcobinamide-phosphate synthase
VIDLVRLLAPDPRVLLLAAAFDLALGDPVYRAHPVRLIGRTLQWFEERLRRLGLDGYGGGILLFVSLACVSLAVLAGVMIAARRASPIASWVLHVFFVYSFLALGDLLHHVWRIELAVRRDDIAAARLAVRALVGRDTDRMDGPGCRRAAVESLSESLTDGFVSAVFWYVVAGLPGLVLFKIVSTMDSMVGYKTPRYIRFGWSGARLDDLMNYVPARITWFLITCIALVAPGLSGRKAWRIGLTQHALLPGPNSGWSEAGTAGAVARRIVGPIWREGVKVTDLWIGDPGDPPLSSATDVAKAFTLVVATGLCALVLAVVFLVTFSGGRA